MIVDFAEILAAVSKELNEEIITKAAAMGITPDALIELTPKYQVQIDLLGEITHRAARQVVGAGVVGPDFERSARYLEKYPR